MFEISAPGAGTVVGPKENRNYDVLRDLLPELQWQLLCSERAPGIKASARTIWATIKFAGATGRLEMEVERAAGTLQQQIHFFLIPTNPSTLVSK